MTNDDRKAAIFEAACRWAEGDGYAILGDRFEFSELNVYRFVGDPRDILVDAYIALTGLTPTQPDREALVAALIATMSDVWEERGNKVALWMLAEPIADKVLALFNGGTNG
jgi:hypothetical protein